MTSNIIPTPNKYEVKNYLSKWSKLPGYVEQEHALNHLFHDVFPNNTDLYHVMLKCSVLNDFYSTNLRMIKNGIVLMATHIVDLNTDKALKQGDENIVNQIARGLGRDDYSFATKYCSHHNEKDYAIYDDYVKKVLVYFNKLHGFSNFKAGDLRNFAEFKRIIFEFRSYYDLDEFSLKEIDQYLWQFGKEVFPKKY